MRDRKKFSAKPPRQVFRNANREKFSQPKLITKLTFWFFWLIVFFLLYLGGQKYFKIDRVFCLVNKSSTPCPIVLAQESQKLIGQPMLFNNINKQFLFLRQPTLNFVSLDYQKVLPGTIFLNFNFNQALYQLITPDGQVFSFAHDGQPTLTLPTDQVLQIQVQYPPTIEDLNQWRADLVLQQKFLFLEYFSRGKRESWDKVVFQDLNTLLISSGQQTYFLDLFDLDDNLQKLDYLQENYLAPPKKQVIDLRFNLPIVMEATAGVTIY